MPDTRTTVLPDDTHRVPHPRTEQPHPRPDRPREVFHAPAPVEPATPWW